MPSADPSGPLGPGEIEALFAPFAGARLLALAVSGGADSLALMTAAAAWRAAAPDRPDLLVLTVDHGLRPESAIEAGMVRAAAAARGIPARILPWLGAKPAAGIEEAARAARYRLLIEAARAAGASHLLVAHHREDQAETVLMRLARGSGVYGLAGMRGAIDLGGLVLARPFLDTPKARLAATARAAGLTPAEDGTNSDSRFARARLRALMPLMAAEGIDPERLAGMAARLRRAAEAIDWMATACLAEAAEIDAFGGARVRVAPLLAVPEEVRLRALSRLVMAVGGGAMMPRGPRVEALAGAIVSGAPLARTLGGAVIRRRGEDLSLQREGGRGLPRMLPGLTYEGLWDGRFHVVVDSEDGAGLEIAALGEAGRHVLAAGSGGMPPPRAAAAVPALRREGRLIAAPTLGFTPAPDERVSVRVTCLVAERLAAPPRFPGQVVLST